MVERLFQALERHSEPDGNDRKFRAIANRILEAAQFEGLAEEILPRLQAFVIPRLTTHPERSDYWVKLLVTHPSDDLDEVLVELLNTSPSVFDWQRFHLWRLVNSLPGPIPEQLLVAARTEAGRNTSPPVAAQAIVAWGHHAENDGREQIFHRHFTPQRPYLIQRAALIAIQELQDALRSRLYTSAVQTQAEHTELVAYLSEREHPLYGEISVRPARQCTEQPREIEVAMRRGVGLIEGQRTTFRLSRTSIHYE